MQDKTSISRYALSCLKRTMDIAIALPLLLVSAPVILVISLAIVATSKGPAIFSQRRLGRGQVPFSCHKLRTMFTGTAAVPTHEASKTAVTPIGKFLRASKLDELPQLWNVVIGEMSLVGPRPGLTDHQELIQRRQQAGVFQIKPGITGYAQVNCIDMSEPARLAAADAEYLRGASFRGDLAILLRTIFPRRLARGS